MINLEQIRILEDKINKAVELINNLRDENSNLRESLTSSQKRIQEFEALVSNFKNDQNEIERTILAVIEKLNRLEDEISEADTPARNVSEDQNVPTSSEGQNDDLIKTENEIAKPEESGVKDSQERTKEKELDIF